MNRKGLTLIELLAVVVILAIAALITVPLVFKIIEDTKESSFLRSVESTFNSVNYYLADDKTIPENGISVTELSLKNGYQFKSGKIIINSEGKYEAVNITDGNFCVSGTKNNLTISKNCGDNNPTPIVFDENKFNIDITTKSISIEVPSSSILEKESNVKNYKFQIINSDYNVNETKSSNINSVIFDNLKENTEYKIKITLTTENNFESTKEISVKTKAIYTPTYTVLPKNLTTSKVVTITYPTRETGFIYTYSLDSGTTWTTVSTGTTASLTFTANGSIIARVYDGTNYKTASSYTITGIDSTGPEVIFSVSNKTTNSITVAATASDPESGITKYEFAIDSGSYINNGTTSTYKFSNVTTGTHTLKVKVTNELDITTEKTISTNPNDIVAPTYAVSPTGFATSKTMTITYPTRETGFVYTYSLDAGTTWTTVATGTTASLTFTANGSVIARVYDGTNYKTASTYTISGIDTTVPTVTLVVSSKTTNSITVAATASDAESNITKYEFAIDSGSYIANGTTSTYKFSGVTTGTHTLKVRVTNGSGLTTESSLSTNPNDIVAPTYVVSPTGWSSSKVVTVTYPTRETGFVYTYSLDAGTTWTTVATGTTAAVTFNANGSIIARVYDGTNYKTASSYTVSGVDSTAPVLNVSKTTLNFIKGQSYDLMTGVTASDAESGINNTVVKLNGNTVTNPSSWIVGTYSIDYISTNNVGLTKTINATVTIYDPIVTNYAYSGNYNTFTAPYAGKYKIELWGAQGGDYLTMLGGKGGYTSGEITLTKNTVLYAYVGGYTNTDAGGYNGGGSLQAGQSAHGRAGGGATDIRLVAGTTSDITSLRSRIMVAGGGGGSNYRNYYDQACGYGQGAGGFGGGLTGGTGESIGHTNAAGCTYGWGIGTGGTQTTGGIYYFYNSAGTVIESIANGSFGYAQIDTSGIQSGGGGGYYGGAFSGHGGAGGGSSFVSGFSGCNAIDSAGNHTGQSIHYSGYKFDNSSLIAGNATMPSISGSTEVGHSGTGYAKITLLSITN